MEQRRYRTLFINEADSLKSKEGFKGVGNRFVGLNYFISMTVVGLSLFYLFCAG